MSVGWKVTFAVLLSGCGATQKPNVAPVASKTEGASPPAQKSPAAFEALLLRESPPGQKYPVDVLGGLLRFSIEGSEAPEVKATSTSQAQPAAQLKMKGFGEDELVCNMVGDTLEVSAVMRNLTETLQFTKQPVLDVGHKGSHATLYLEGPYVSKANPTQGGTFKMAALFGDRGSLLCAEGSAGYSKTFRRVMQGVFETAQISGEGKGILSEVARFTARGQAIGVGLTHVNREGAGYLSREYAFILATAQDRWVAHSLVEETLYDAKGRLERKAVRDVNMGTVESGTEYQRTGPQAFRYHRTHQGKDVSGTLELKAATAPLNHRVINLEILKRGKDFTYTSLSGSEELSVVYTLSRQGSALQRTSSEHKGSPATIELDAEGNTAKVKENPIETEFISRQGTLPVL